MKKTTGIEKVPRILKDPFWTDRFFWIGVGCAIFWASVIWWLVSG
ncbi:MAG: hypothetical protein AAF478_12695 [Pseudomonadota bacterium]